MIEVLEIVKQDDGQYFAKKRLINPEHISSISLVENLKEELREDIRNELDPKTSFSEIELMTGTKVLVVGGIAELQNKLLVRNYRNRNGTKMLLKS